MPLLTKIKKYLIFIFYAIPFSKKYKHIFIFSHKRGRTTLLSHILGSHDKICGYRELHCRYTHKIDLLKSRVALFQDKEAYLSADFLLDKILHNEWQFDEKITGEANNHYLFVLRDPEETMLSMIKRHIDLSGPKDVKIQEIYFIGRLKELRTYWSNLKGPKLAIDSNQIVENSEHELLRISHFLGLDKPLKASYTTFEETGVAGAGDMSENISSGFIKFDKKEFNANDQELLQLVDMTKVKKEFAITKKLLFDPKCKVMTKEIL